MAFSKPMNKAAMENAKDVKEGTTSQNDSGSSSPSTGHSTRANSTDHGLSSRRNGPMNFTLVVL